MNKRKLTRETLTELAKRMPVLSEEVQHSYVGGYDYNSQSSCFFNCMEYLAKEICGIQNVDCDTFGNAYWSGVDDYVGTGKRSDYLYGPKMFDESGAVNPNLLNFVKHYYNIEGSGWIMGNNDIQTLFTSASSDDTAIIAVFNTGMKDTKGNDIAHCVILQSYDKASDTYTYYDPSVSGTEEEKIRMVSGSLMMFAVRAGCK